MNINSGSMFVNNDGRTVKVADVSNGRVMYTVDGGYEVKTDKLEVVNKMLESAGYRDITKPLSSFAIIGHYGVGSKLASQDLQFEAEVIKKDDRGFHVKFSTIDKSNTTTYIYDSSDFNLSTIFTTELLAELANKFSNNVFEVIGEVSASVKTSPGGNVLFVQDENGISRKEIKFTVLGKSINKELLEKINKVHNGIVMYSIKRLTNINIK